MPSDLTIFAAKYLVFIDVALAIAVIGYALYREPRIEAMRWAIAIAIVLVLSLVLARVGAAMYSDPRPFTQDHVKPLIAHAAGNGFPSDHALLAAAIVAAVLLIRPLWSLPFVVLAILVDWARVGAGVHHVVDVIGSSVIVAIATLIAVFLAPLIVRRLAPRFGPVEESEPAASG